MKIISLSLGVMSVNTYIVYDEINKKAIIIDPGDEGDKIMEKINKNDLSVEYIVLTHGHFDHIGAISYLKRETNAKIAIHPSDADCLIDSRKNLSEMLNLKSIQVKHDILLNEGDVIKFGDLEFKVIHTPGHSLGSISLLGEGVIFTGDALFKGTIGRTDFPGGDYNELLNSINEKIMALDDEIIVYPGHDEITTIEEERRNNPYVKGN